jgi:hypothetical protein
MTQEHCGSNDTYRLRWSRPKHLVSVLNAGGLLLAEYDRGSGRVWWHQVVPPPKRESLKRRLGEKFPASSSDPRTATRYSKRRLRALRKRVSGNGRPQYASWATVSPSTRTVNILEVLQKLGSAVVCVSPRI